MPFIKPKDNPIRPLVLGLYGEVGLGKTTLASTANKSVLIDFDRGYHRAGVIKDPFAPDSWEEFSKSFSAGEFDGFQTLIIDTAKAALDDFLMPYVIRKEPRLKSNKLGAYGAIQDEFKLFVNDARLKNMDIIWIAHSKDEKEGDMVVKTPDITGGSYGFMLRISDQIGYMSMIAGQRTIAFEIADRTRTKDTAGIGKVSIPAITANNYDGFMGQIIATTKEAIKARQETLVGRSVEVDKFAARINQANTPEQINTIMAEITAIEDKAVETLVKAVFKPRVKELGYAYNKVTFLYELPAKPSEIKVELGAAVELVANAKTVAELDGIAGTLTPAVMSSAAFSNAVKQKREFLTSQEAKVTEPTADLTPVNDEDLLSEIHSALGDVDGLSALNALMDSFEFGTMEQARANKLVAPVMAYAKANGFFWNKDTSEFVLGVEPSVKK